MRREPREAFTGDRELDSFNSWEFDSREYQLCGTYEKGLPAECRHCVREVDVGDRTDTSC